MLMFRTSFYERPSKLNLNRAQSSKLKDINFVTWCSSLPAQNPVMKSTFPKTLTMCARLCPSSTRGFYDLLRGGAEGNSTTCRGFELSLGERHVSWHVCWHRHAGTARCHRFWSWWAHKSLWHVRIEVLEDQEKVLTVSKEMQTPVLLFCSQQKYFENKK